MNVGQVCIYQNKSMKIDLNGTLGYKDYELNLLNYENALITDKRTFLQTYKSLLRAKHLILFTFFNDNNYNVYNIKVSFFFFTFALYFTLNVLFFNDETIHNIYQNGGKYDFIYQIPQIIYSTTISFLINIIIRHLSLSEKEVLQLKNSKKFLNRIIMKTKKCIKIKFILFYLFTFILLIFFWLYLSCFCAVYTNSQKYVLHNTSISYGLSLLYPFLFTLISAILRMLSLNNRNNKIECIYNLSQLI